MPAKKRTRPGSNGLPAANTHALRELAGTPADPDVVLASLPIGTPDYLRVIGAYLRKYNHQHARKHKGVGFKTMLERQRLYASFFTELRQHTAYRNLDPRQLANRHVEVVVRRWLERGLKTATLHNYLSFLRTFAGWIGKRGMVREPAYYVGSESPHAHRCGVATEDGSWTARNVEIKAKIAEIASFDSWSGMQLELELHFGLRGKEARHLRPHGAIIPREAAHARDAAAFPECQTFLHISAGAKGGRPRDVPIATDEQRELLARVLSAVAPGGFVGRPGFTTSQNQARFYYVIRKFGISKAGLGVVAHGMRHQYANDHFEADSGAASPVRGGKARPPGSDIARRRVARALGHYRGRASSSYIGSDAGLPGTPTDASPDQSGDGSG
jgi:integrase